MALVQHSLRHVKTWRAKAKLIAEPKGPLAMNV
jgi:hypothetical protein